MHEGGFWVLMDIENLANDKMGIDARWNSGYNMYCPASPKHKAFITEKRDMHRHITISMN